MVNAGEETRKKTKNREISWTRSHDIFFGFTIWLRSHTVVNKVPFGTSEPYGDRARRRLESSIKVIFSLDIDATSSNII